MKNNIKESEKIKGKTLADKKKRPISYKLKAAQHNISTETKFPLVAYIGGR